MANRPCVTAFCEDAALPASVFGPVDFSAFLRFWEAAHLSEFVLLEYVQGFGVGAVGIAFVSYVLVVFGLLAVALGFVFGAEACPAPFFLGGIVFYSVVLDLLDLADCLEE